MCTLLHGNEVLNRGSSGHSMMQLALCNEYARHLPHDKNNNQQDEFVWFLQENYDRQWRFSPTIELYLFNVSSIISEFRQYLYDSQTDLSTVNTDLGLGSLKTIPALPSHGSLDLPPVSDREISAILAFVDYLKSIGYFNSSPSPLAICHQIDSSAIQMAAKRTNVNTAGGVTKKTKKNENKLRHQPIPGLCGLVNIGNTCFMNSALQCLSNIPDLTQWAKKDEQHLSIKCKSVTQAYISLIRSMWSGQNWYFTPRDIKYEVSRSASIFRDYAQKDSHEFLNSLLNALHMELIDSSQSSSIVTNLFQIKTESQVTCLACQDCDKNEETTFCLPLPITNEVSYLTLDQLLTGFLKEDNLDGEYYCLKCEDLKKAKQKTNLLLPLPRVIIIQLKRFSFDETFDKIETFIRYPLVNWNPMNTMEGPFYNLVSVSRHVGNLKGGHYTTFARLNGNGDWYHFNDTCCELVDDLSTIVTHNAYLLIYLRND